ncbi:carbohydrate esterase family 8 protein [Chaetomium sp. MPI-SDFR-AT-0129]|nr:carbohydrate esterase family 8 protein [Chaetomium sp. MPI-SDFR-AT-0129]
MFSPFTLLLTTTITAAAATPLLPRAGRTTPPEGCLTVGGSGTYSTLQSAVNALSPSTTTAQCIFIYAGTYKEQVSITTALKSSLTLYGETPDTSSYSANTVTITQSKSQDDGVGNDETATLRAHTTDFSVYNINLVNTRGQGSQALALSAQADRQGYYGCQFRGFQDTVLANEGAQVYAKSYIEGATDFIFGQRGKAWFDGVDIRVVAASVGYITASGRESADDGSWYVINKSTVAAKSGDSVGDGVYYLGRPWREYARVVFQNTDLSSVINGAGWKVWNAGDERTSGVEFGEFGNTGAGAQGTRASFSEKLAQAVGIETVLGSGYADWVDAEYLS